MSKRHDRLTELFLREVGAGLNDVCGLNDDGILTITGVRLSGDGRILKVFYSVLGTYQQAQKKAQLLATSAKELRAIFFKRLRLKYIPEILFEFDETPQKAARIEELLDKIKTVPKTNNDNDNSKC